MECFNILVFKAMSETNTVKAPKKGLGSICPTSFLSFIMTEYKADKMTGTPEADS